MQDYIDRKIDINGKIDKITVKQFDNDSRYLHVTIRDDDLPDSDDKAFNLTGCTAALYIQPAGDESGENVAFVAGEVSDAEEGIVTFLLPGSVTQAVRDHECEIWMYEGSSSNRPIISGQPFTMTVEKSIRNTSAIMASPRFSALDAWGSEVAALRSEMNELVASPGGSGGDTGTELRNIRVGWDGYTYDTAGEAVRKQLRALYDQLNETVIVGNNVFNPETALLNYTVNTTTGGLEITTDGDMVSAKIPTHGAAYAIFSYLPMNGTHEVQAFRVFQYDADGAFIRVDTDSVVALVAGCATIRFYASSAFAQHRDRIMVELSDDNTMSDFEPYHMYLNPQISVTEVRNIRIGWDGYEYDSAGDAVRKQVRELHDSLDEKFTVGRNVFNPDAVTEYRYINDSTGEILINTHDTFISDRIPTNGKAKAIFSYVRSDGMQVLQTFKVYQYKANGDFISLTEASVVTLDGQCSYIRFYASSNFTDVRARIMVELADSGVSTFSVFEKYQQRLAPAVSIWKSAASVMSKLILPNKPFTVKLIGDSITQGVGSSDYDASGDVIISDNPTAWSRNVGAKAWAAMFEARVANDNISVINNGVRGCSTHQILYYWNQLIDGTEDIVICMLGTNNRTTADNSTFSYTKQSFYDELQKIKNTLEANGSEVVFMSAPPASVSNESQSGIHFHMNDVDDVISKFAADNNREYISLYKKTLDYMKKTGATLDDLLDDGLHPNDRLHKLMYGWIVEGIGLNREHNPVIDSFMITTNEISEVLTG